MDMLSACQPESPSLEVPKWLDILENRRKRPHRLAHEIGAGSPCLVCKEKCKGLNLHFWRKICTECKCRKEDHDFVDEEYVQFEILFGAKRVKKTTVQYNAHKKIFDWVPPNAPQDLVVDYLNALPESKLPITNSKGAIYRKQQLEKQLPVHDVNPSACHNLTDKEVSEFGKYLESLRNDVIGQGKIMKFEQCNFLTDKYNPCSSSSDTVGRSRALMSGPHCVGIRAQLVRVGDHEVNTVFSEKVNGQAYSAESVSKIDYVNHNKSYLGVVTPKIKDVEPNAGAQNHDHILYPDIVGKMQDLSVGPLPCRPVTTQNTASHEEVFKNLSARPCMEFRTPSLFVKGQQPVCDNQNNYAGVHLNDNDVLPKNHAREAISDRLSAHISNNVNNHKIPPDFESSPTAFKKEPFNVNVMNTSSNDLPFTPLQESQNLSSGRVSDLPGKDYIQWQDSDHERKSHANCLQCKEMFVPDDIVVAAERGGDSALWHARCFVCHTCEELLVDLMYFYQEGKVYCGRDYAKVRNIPRCFACDELIFVKEYTQAEGETYHVKHFCCFLCDVPLAGKQYIPKDNHPVCLGCYQTNYGKTCNTCSELIPVSEQRISVGEFNFHVTLDCFRCENCLKFLKGQRFVMKNGKAFCSKECFQLFQM